MGRKEQVSRLAALIEANMQRDAALITCTYKEDALPENTARAEKDAKMFVSRLKSHWMKVGLCAEAFRFVYTTQSIHEGKWVVYVVLMCLPDALREDIESIWGYGFCNVERLKGRYNTSHIASWITWRDDEVKYKTNIREETKRSRRAEDAIAAIERAADAIKKTAESARNAENTLALAAETLALVADMLKEDAPEAEYAVARNPLICTFDDRMIGERIDGGEGRLE